MDWRKIEEISKIDIVHNFSFSLLFTIFYLHFFYQDILAFGILFKTFIPRERDTCACSPPKQSLYHFCWTEVCLSQKRSKTRDLNKTRFNYSKEKERAIIHKSRCLSNLRKKCIIFRIGILFGGCKWDFIITKGTPNAGLYENRPKSAII